MTMSQTQTLARLRTLDLNLVVALDALLQERSVTAAARQLGVTQSTMSHTLARLRSAFGDPLLIRTNRAMVSTPRADALADPLRRLLLELGQLVVDAPFDAATTTRSFVLACPDLAARFLPELVSRLARLAPHATLELRTSGDLDVPKALALGSVDVALAPLGATPSVRIAGLVAKRLGVVHHAVLARREHPALRRRGARPPLDLATWLAFPHVQVRTGEGSGLVDRVLARAGQRRKIGVVVPSFLLAPHIVARTDMFFSTPRELVIDLLEPLGLTLHEPPIAIPPLPISALWHERSQADPGHVWLRAQVVAQLESTLGLQASGGTRLKHSSRPRSRAAIGLRS